MKHILVLLFLAASLFSSAQTDDDSRVLNEFIVMLSPGQKPAEIVREYPALHMKRCLSNRMNIWLVERNTSDRAEGFLLLLQRNPKIKLAQFNHHIQQRSIVPNDSFFNLQWGLRNLGSNGGVAGADIQATDAWAVNHNNITVNGDTIVVAVVDYTFDLNHEDINYFINRHEIPNNSVDDDGNGYIDDYEGWNVFDTSGQVNSTGFDAEHSTHCAGIAAAIGNNGKGIAGVCWGCKVLPIAGSSDYESEVVAAYDYVVNMRSLYNATSGAKGAFITSTNSSFGVDYGKPADYPIWCALYDSMGAVGVLSAGATANIALNVDAQHDIPTECPSKWLLAVTNTTRKDKINTGAAWGKINVDLGAPGTSVYSTVPASSYDYLTGTSMATPHVAGVVAAMFAAACPKLINDYYLYPDSIARIVKQMILDGTVQNSDLYKRTLTGGRLNLYRAIRNLDEYNCNDCEYSLSSVITQPVCSNSCDGAVQLNVSGSGVYRYNWSTGDSNTTQLQNLCPDFYSVTVTDSASGCQRVKNFSVNKPDSIVVSSVTIIPATGNTSGNIIVLANAGNYTLQFSLDSINYQSSATLVVPSNGDYDVYVKSETGCVAKRNVIVSAVNDMPLITELAVYPNPAGNTLNISFNISSNMDVSFSVQNVLGESVLQQTQQIAPGIHTATLDLSLVENGIYFLQLNGPNFSATHKFVVVK